MIKLKTSGDFVLSDKIVKIEIMKDTDAYEMFKKRDVKEFVRRLSGLIKEKASIEKIACKMLINSKSLRNIPKKERMKSVKSKSYMISVLHILQEEIDKLAGEKLK